MDSQKDLQRLLQIDIRTEIAPDLIGPIISKRPFISIPGLFNLRDLSTDHPASIFPVVLRPGIIYRSGVLPTAPSPETQIALVEELGITTIFDLRRSSERTKSPSPVIEGIETVWFPYTFEPPRPVEHENVEPVVGVVRSYRMYLDSHAPVFRKVFEHIRDRPRDPFLFHCSGGKDRTGVLAALILRLAGSSDEAIIHDYMLTRVGIEPARPALTAMLRAHYGVEGDGGDLDKLGKVAVLGVEEKGMEGFLKALDEIDGGVVGYLKQGLGFSEEDVDTIRRNLAVGL